MPFAELLRRASPSVPSATTPSTEPHQIHGSAPLASSSKPRASPSALDRFALTRTAKSRAQPSSPQHLLYPPSSSAHRASHYSASDDQSIGEAPSHSDSVSHSASQRASPAAALANEPVSIPSELHASQASQHDRLLGLPPKSTSTSPLPSNSTLAGPSSSASASALPSAQAPPPSASLLRRRSTKQRQNFPPAAPSTGTSSSQRDRSIMGSAVFRRPSLRRRTGSNDSTASRTDKTAPPISPPLPYVERKQSDASLPSAVDQPPQSAQPTSRLARLFGRRKSVSGSSSATTHTFSNTVEPVPPLRDAASALNRASPPLAVISADWKDPDAPPSPKQKSHARAPSQPSATTAARADRISASAPSTATATTRDDIAAFAFPSRAPPAVADASTQSQPLGVTRPRQAKHSTSRSLPLASLATSTANSSSPPATASPAATTSADAAVPQRRPSRLGRSLSHRKSSKSLSMFGTMFGAAASPPLPQSESQPISDISAEQTTPAPTSNHARRPSLRARLKLGRSATDNAKSRPTTPEIESWKQRDIHVFPASAAAPARRGRASIDAPARPRTAEVPVKITRSKSVIRRKPAPEVRQEEIDSSSSTPVYGKTFRALDVDPTVSSPVGGSLASSPLAQPALLAGSDTEARMSPILAFNTQTDATVSRQPQIETDSAHGLGLDLGSANHADTSLPSIDVRPSTPSRDSPSAAGASNAGNPSAEAGQRKLVPGVSPSAANKRMSSGAPSVADTSLSVDRPWSLISAGEADTPLLKLRKLIVNTESSDESRDLDASDGLFFRAPGGTTAHDAATKDDEAGQEVVSSELDAEQPRSSSQTTTRSDTKHEIASVHSSGSSTLRPVRALVERESLSALSAAASTAMSEASQADTIRASVHRRRPSIVTTQASAGEGAEREADSIGPLPAKSPAGSQHSFLTRQHRRDGSTGSAYSQATVQQGRRASTASRLTARSSGHWSESRLSEDALSALEAEVGQARRAEVVALGKGRVRDWVGGGGADRMLPTTEAPTLSRSNTLRKKAELSAPTTADAGATEVDIGEREAQRQKALNEHLSRRLQQLSDAQDAPASVSSDAEIRDIPDQRSSDEGAPSAEKQEAPSAASGARFGAPRFARLSAFNDRKMMEAAEPAAEEHVVAPTTSTTAGTDEAIRLGRAPSKRVRRNVSEARSSGEAVMVSRAQLTSAHRRASTTTSAAALSSGRLRRRSNSVSGKKTSSAEQWNPTLVPAMPAPAAQAAPAASAAEVVGMPATSTVDSQPEAVQKAASRVRSFATSEEAARAKQRELLDREQRHAEKEARRQAHLQEKYAKKKQSDPLLAARLALAGLQPIEAVPRPPTTQTLGRAARVPVARTPLFGTGLQVPEAPERRGSGTSPGLLSASGASVRRSSVAGSVASFHTAMDVPAAEGAAVSIAASPKTTGEASFGSKGRGEVRPDTSYSIASSLAVDFEFPVPPQRMREQLSEDGTLLSRAGLEESPLQPQWRERRHYAGTPKIRTPPRDSSLRHREASRDASPELAQAMTTSTTMPKLGAVSPLDSFQQTVALRRSRSVGFNSRDLRRMTRDQMARDVERHPSPKSQPRQLHVEAKAEQGLGIEFNEALVARRYSNTSGSGTPSTLTPSQRLPIVA